MDTVYRNLARKYNAMGMGLPETDEGYELQYIAELITPEEAEFCLKMPLGLHTAEEFASDMQMDVDETRAMLEKLSVDGLTLHVDDDGVDKYYLMPIIHGFLELNVGRFNDVIAKSFGAHYTRGMGARFFGSKAPLFRILPAKKELVENDECLPSDDPHAIIERNTRFALTECFCRKSTNWGRGTTCKHTPEFHDTCMVMGIFADYYLDYLKNSGTVEITKEEAHRHMDKTLEMGTIVEVINTKNVEVMCCCCECCCGVIKALLMYGGESAGFASNYQIRYEKDDCIDCHKCASACVTGACVVNKRGKLKVNPDKCIGCGLCVAQCPTKAVKLYRKPAVYFPPDKDVMGMYDYVRSLRRKGGEI